MALHTVPDPPGEDTLGLADQSELDAVAALISTGSTAEPPPTEPRFVMIDRSRADTQVPARTVAGWYPDESDPGLRRYWDGHHLTGQTVRVDAEGTEPLDPEGMAVGGKPVAGPLPRMVSTTRDQAAESSWTTLRVAGGLPAVPEEPAVDQPAEPAGSDADTTGATGSNADAEATGATGSDTDAEATGEAAQDTPDLWADKVVDAVARARAAGTPEEWRQVASVAVVVSELAGTMVVATSAARAAEEAGRMAERTRQDADAAAEQAAAARAAEQEATERARRAQEAATAAAEAAAQAAEEATRAEREAPEVAAVADTAAREAASAQATLEGITTIVAEAEAADTPDAWSEAHRLAEAALAS